MNSNIATNVYIRWIGNLFILILIAACGPIPQFGMAQNPRHIEQSNLQVTENILYALTNNRTESGQQQIFLVLLDKATWKEVKRTQIHQSGVLIRQIDQDLQGRLWIGYSGEPGVNTRDVDVFLANGDYLKTIQPCSNVGSHTYFTSSYAFVICRRNGFKASVSVVDLNTLENVKEIEISEEPYFLLLASGKSDEEILLYGSSDTKATLSTIDLTTLEIENTQYITSGGYNGRTLLYYKDKFYLLNIASYLDSSQSPADTVTIDSSVPYSVSTFTLPARSPVFGEVLKDEMYTYHNPNSYTDDDLNRSISRVNLATGAMTNWPLPDFWDASDMDLVNGKVILTRKFSLNPQETDGFYEFDTETGKLTQIMALEDARILFVPANAQ